MERGDEVTATEYNAEIATGALPGGSTVQPPTLVGR